MAGAAYDSQESCLEDAQVSISDYSRLVYNLAYGTHELDDREEQSAARISESVVLPEGEEHEFTMNAMFQPLYHAWWNVVHQLSIEWFQDEGKLSRWDVTELLIEYSRKLIQQPGKFDDNPWDFFEEDALMTWQYHVYDAIHIEEQFIQKACAPLP